MCLDVTEGLVTQEVTRRDCTATSQLHAASQHVLRWFVYFAWLSESKVYVSCCNSS